MNKNNSPLKQIWTTDEPLNDKVLQFTSGNDVVGNNPVDYNLIYFDILTNIAHCQMLNIKNIISNDEFYQIKEGLLNILSLYKNNKFKLIPTFEDVHINIEYYLTYELKIKAAEKLHTARSRNDQVATDMRLYIRHNLTLLIQNCSNFIQELLKEANKYKCTIFPGFSHYQPAMYTTLGHYYTSWSQAELRNLTRLFDCLKLYNSCPLGSAAGFGTSWNIDRKISAKLLGFLEPDENTLDSISSRGELECQTAANLSIVALNWGRIAQDIILFSQPYYDLLKIEKKYTTGSSIMPQKNNPDVLELIRAKSSYIHGYLNSLLATVSKLPSGYNRDHQLTKNTIIELFKDVIDIPILLGKIIKSLTVNEENSLNNKPFLNNMITTDIANWLAIYCKIGFRKAYTIIRQLLTDDNSNLIDINSIKLILQKNNITVPNNINEIINIDSQYSVNSRKHIGSPAKEMLELSINNQQKKLNIFLKEFNNFRENYQIQLNNLIN